MPKVEIGTIQFNGQQVQVGSTIKFDKDQIITRKYSASGGIYVVDEFLVDTHKLVKEFNSAPKTQQTYAKLWSVDRMLAEETSHLGFNAVVTKMSISSITLSMETIVGGIKTHRLGKDPKFSDARVSKKKVVITKAHNKELFS